LEGSFQELDKTLNQIENDATRLKHEVEQDRVTPTKAVVAKQGGDGLIFLIYFFPPAYSATVSGLSLSRRGAHISSYNQTNLLIMLCFCFDGHRLCSSKGRYSLRLTE